MKALVCVCRVPDTTAKIIFKDNNTALEQNGIQKIMNPYDEWYALVRAIEAKESAGTGEVTILTVDNAEGDSILRKGLSIGADKALRINKEPKDCLETALEIAHYAKEHQFDMILCGKESIDFNGNAVAGMVAQLLDLPYIPLATKLTFEAGKATVKCEEEGGEKTLEVNDAFVLSTAKGIAEARIPNMRGIMAARTKPLEVIEPSFNNTFTEIVHYEMPPEASECKMISPDNLEALIEELKNNANVF